VRPWLGGKLQPALKESFEFAVKLLAYNSRTLTSDQLDLLQTGLINFPRDLDLLFLAATGKAARGDTAEAAALAERGLKLASSSDDRTRFSNMLFELKPR
jgi:hypothetical protein